MTGLQGWVAATKDDIRRLGGAFMKSPEARRDATRLGLPGFEYYFFRGRGGVLENPVTPEVVAVVSGFFPSDFVRDHWYEVRPPLPACKLSLRYTCGDWGRRSPEGFASAPPVPRSAFRAPAGPARGSLSP